MIQKQHKDDLGELGAYFFKPNEEVDITRRNLPHWYQEGVYFFITFRLVDSIPKEKAQQLKEDRLIWQKTHQNQSGYSLEEWKEYNRLFHERVEEWLNAGYGSCLLGKKVNAEIIADALRFFDGQRYDLDEWVVMPNHVHLTVKPYEGNKIKDILHSWKSYTANEINKLENRTGPLWMGESFDHIVRNKISLESIRKYIRQNPAKAGVKAAASSFM